MKVNILALKWLKVETKSNAPMWLPVLKRAIPPEFPVQFKSKEARTNIPATEDGAQSNPRGKACEEKLDRLMLFMREQ